MIPRRPRLTYAITPPNQTTPVERRRAIAAAHSARIAALPIDALLVYDVQDEAARNDAPRPFSFIPKVDPLTYAYEALELDVPRVVYRTVAEQDESSFCRWLDRLQERRGSTVFVGAPSRRSAGSLSLPQALSLCRSHAPDLHFGGVLIAERHEVSGGEDVRVWKKTEAGCRFFVSQTVWSVSAAERLLRDLRRRVDVEGGEPPPILLTLSPCGSPQTLDFMEWLGVSVPDHVKQELTSAKDMLRRSVELATQTFAEVRAFAASHGISVGCNVESVSVRPDEVEASVELVRRIDQLPPEPLRLERRAQPLGGAHHVL